nr:unnamed protein product [Leishmania braziliensis]
MSLSTSLHSGSSTPKTTWYIPLNVSSAAHKKRASDVASAQQFRSAVRMQRELRLPHCMRTPHSSDRLPTRRSNGCRPTGDAAPAFVVYTTRGAQEASAAPSPLLGSAFTVVEERKGRLRRRLTPLAATSQSLAGKEHRYKGVGDLDEQPQELVLDECGGVTELTASLLQVLLPLHLRALFSLRARGGSVHQ